MNKKEETKSKERDDMYNEDSTEEEEEEKEKEKEEEEEEEEEEIEEEEEEEGEEEEGEEEEEMKANVAIPLFLLFLRPVVEGASWLSSRGEGAVQETWRGEGSMEEGAEGEGRHEMGNEGRRRGPERLREEGGENVGIVKRNGGAGKDTIVRRCSTRDARRYKEGEGGTQEEKRWKKWKLWSPYSHVSWICLFHEPSFFFCLFFLSLSLSLS